MQPFVLLAAVVVFLGLTSALNNGLARTPQMGWNSWNWFGCSINETIFRATAQAIVDTGLAKAGYQYVCELCCLFFSVPRLFDVQNFR